MSSTEEHEGGTAAAASAGTPLLEMRGISKSFPGVKALINVGLTASAGEIHALMGENGAGKSTLIKIMSGAYDADPGSEIRIDGAPVVIDSPAAAIAHGIAVIYQEFHLIPALSARENIFLGQERTWTGFLSRGRESARVREVLHRLGAVRRLSTSSLPSRRRRLPKPSQPQRPWRRPWAPRSAAGRSAIRQTRRPWRRPCMPPVSASRDRRFR